MVFYSARMIGSRSTLTKRRATAEFREKILPARREVLLIRYPEGEARGTPELTGL